MAVLHTSAIYIMGTNLVYMHKACNLSAFSNRQKAIQAQIRCLRDLTYKIKVAGFGYFTGLKSGHQRYAHVCIDPVFVVQLASVYMHLSAM
jgi:hypothetical protein